MSQLPEQYLLTTRNLEDFLNSLINAQPPKKVTQKFLETLEFKSTNDRLFIGVLKALNFIDSEGVPQSLYYEFIDQTQSKKVLADAIRDSYSDLFAVNKTAETLTEAEVKNKFKTLLQGSKSDKVVGLMAKTFRALCDYADFSKTETTNDSLVVKEDNNQYENEAGDEAQARTHSSHNTENRIVRELKAIQTEMHYNIQIHLPETRDLAVYEAIFKALKEHLL